MKQAIRDLLRDGSRDYRGVYNGDTYERYAKRCKLAGIEPKEFREWLAYELAMAKQAGPHVKLDDHQRVMAMTGQAG